MPDCPQYSLPPIRSCASLARMLRCSIGELTRVELAADTLYREVIEVKEDGSPRVCYDAKPPLKAMQARIQCMILKAAYYPSYLMGGLADQENPRDYVRNAKLHAGARVMVNEDVAGFFPSTTDRIIFDIWRQVFHFPPDVSRTLTRLTTRKGQLPQGAKTSSYLANLVFWGLEPIMVEKLQAMGFGYTRYIDDMTISSTADKTPEELGVTINLMASLLKRHGLRFKRRKHKIAYAGERMEVTGLVVGKNSAGLSRAIKSRIRAMVHQCEIAAKTTPGDSPALRRAASLVGQYARLHPTKGRALKARLKALKLEA